MLLLCLLLRTPTPPSGEKSCHTTTFPHVLHCNLPCITQVPGQKRPAQFTTYCTSHKIQLWQLSQAHQSHVLKCFFVSALLGVSIIYTEVLARLLFFVPSYPEVIRKLCQECLSWYSVCPYPVLIPLCGFLQPPGGALRRTLTGFLKGRISPGDKYSPRIYLIIHL